MLKHVVLGTLKTIEETVLRADSNSPVRVNSFWIANTSSSSDDLYLYQVPAGGSASTSNALFYANTIRGNASTTVDPAGIVLEPGESLVASSANGGRLVLHVYTEVSS
jgi:hypothetical protein